MKKRDTCPFWVTIVLLISTCLVCFTFCAGWSRSAASSEHGGVTEYEVKAAFLVHFIKFIEWPEDQAGTTGREIILCIAGENPFGEAISLLRGTTIRGRPLVIKTEVDKNSSCECHMLFIPASERGRVPFLMNAVEGLPVLTVSEIDDFTLQGGMINFIIVDNRIRFEINPDAAKRCGLQISAQLLKLARIVKAL